MPRVKLSHWLRSVQILCSDWLKSCCWISTNERAPLWAEMFSSLSSIKTSFITASDVFAEPQVVLDREIGQCSDDIWSLTLVQTLYQFSVLKAEGRLLIGCVFPIIWPQVREIFSSVQQEMSLTRGASAVSAGSQATTLTGRQVDSHWSRTVEILRSDWL